MRKLSKNLVQIAAGLSLILAASCAKMPASGDNFITKRLIFTVNLAGDVRYGQVGAQLPYIYIIPLRLSTVANPTDLGPIPVTTFGGNGFVAGNCTHFIIYDPASQNPYQIWRFSDNGLINKFQTGLAINFQDPKTSGKPRMLQFEIDMSQLVPAADVDSILSIQANILTMDRYAVDASGHTWDALGDGRLVSQDNTFLTFELRNSRKITNTATQLEPPDEDVRGASDPQLDVRDWSVEIRLQQ